MPGERSGFNANALGPASLSFHVKQLMRDTVAAVWSKTIE
jgi:hypothetical protein